MRKKLEFKRIYRFMLSQRDLISFVSGIIVSGYVVEISLNADNKFYWFTIMCGLCFSFLTYVLLKISNSLNNQFAIYKYRNPNLSDEQNYIDSWNKINKKDDDSNKIFNKFSIWWMPKILCLLPLLLLLSILFFHCGNQENEIKKSKEQSFQIQKIDSLFKEHIKAYETDKLILKDSLQINNETIMKQRKHIDSLEHQIKLIKKK